MKNSIINIFNFMFFTVLLFTGCISSPMHNGEGMDSEIEELGTDVNIKKTWEGECPEFLEFSQIIDTADSVLNEASPINRQWIIWVGANHKGNAFLNDISTKIKELHIDEIVDKFVDLESNDLLGKTDISPIIPDCVKIGRLLELRIEIEYLLGNNREGFNEAVRLIRFGGAMKKYGINGFLYGLLQQLNALSILKDVAHTMDRGMIEDVLSELGSLEDNKNLFLNDMDCYVDMVLKKIPIRILKGSCGWNRYVPFFGSDENKVRLYLELKSSMLRKSISKENEYSDETYTLLGQSSFAMKDLDEWFNCGVDACIHPAFLYKIFWLNYNKLKSYIEELKNSSNGYNGSESEI